MRGNEEQQQRQQQHAELRMLFEEEKSRNDKENFQQQQVVHDLKKFVQDLKMQQLGQMQQLSGMMLMQQMQQQHAEQDKRFETGKMRGNEEPNTQYTHEPIANQPRRNFFIRNKV